LKQNHYLNIKIQKWQKIIDINIYILILGKCNVFSVTTSFVGILLKEVVRCPKRNPTVDARPKRPALHSIRVKPKQYALHVVQASPDALPSKPKQAEK
jgi:hypothetical protein